MQEFSNPDWWNDWQEDNFRKKLVTFHKRIRENRRNIYDTPIIAIDIAELKRTANTSLKYARRIATLVIAKS